MDYMATIKDSSGKIIETMYFEAPEEQIAKDKAWQLGYSTFGEKATGQLFKLGGRKERELVHAWVACI